jgi:hypothetical protein
MDETRRSGSVVYVDRERERRLSARERERPRSGYYLSTSAAALGGREEVIDSYGTVEAPRQTLFLEEGPLRTSRSITYATTGPRLSRERVVVEEAGRRRESYRLMS